VVEQEPIEKRHGITLSEFHDILVSMTDLDGMSPVERNQRTKTWASQHQPYDQLTLTPGNEFHDFFTQMNAAPEFTQMVALAKQLRIHEIMLDPFLARRLGPDKECLVLTRAGAAELKQPGAEYVATGHFLPKGDAGVGPYGPGTRYHIASDRLLGAEVSFVYLVIDPGGFSVEHHHPGDELFFVLDGLVELHFPDSGARFKLGRHSYVHFYAEQEHAAANVASDGKAEVFIIRFHHNGRQSMRRQLWDHSGVGTVADALTCGWVLEAAAGRSVKDRGEIPADVLNRLGLARHLAMLPPPTPGADVELRTVIRAHTGEELYPSLEVWQSQLARGLTRVPRGLIPALHKTFGADPLLFWDYLFPAMPWRVAVARDKDRQKRRRRREWIPWSEIPHAPATVGVNYELPSRNLLCSDISISWLELSGDAHGGAQTTSNRHDGFELLLPIEGAATVSFEGLGDQCTVSAGTNMAHYNSGRPHVVRNDSKKPAQLFVVRFHRPAPGAADQASPAKAPAG
jgi:quercetin dioxygenase-like cupin family protein